MNTVRSPWQQFYGWAHAQRRRYWATRSESLARPVVSIGNLHWGGSGKTPTVIAAARGLQAGGRRVAVLSRGYRRRGRTPLLVSDREPGIDVFLLDDGFSHLRVRRDVEVLTFPADDPFAGGLLLPGGRLREPLGMARLADAAVITGLEAGAEPPADFRSILRRHGFAGRVFASLLWAELAGGPPPDRPLLATGVARAERVARTAATAGLEVVRHLRFRDHHGYPPRSLRAIEAACVRHRCDAVVTTSKDAVKLRGRLPVGVPQLLELRIEARLAPEFLPWLSDRLER